MVATLPFQAPDLAPHTMTVQRPPAPLWEQGLISLWFLVTFIPFPNDELLLYPLALFFAAGFALRIRQLLPLTLKCWPLFLIPIMTALSMFWSPVSSAALRLGIMMTLTVMIGIYIAGRLTPREIVRAVFAACAVSAIVAIPEMANLEDEIGLYPQKNIFAIRMMLVMLVSLGIALDVQQNLFLRVLAAPFVVLTLYMVVRAESLTALGLGGASLIVMLAVWLVWTNVSRIRHLRTLIATVIVGVLTVGILLFLNLPNNTVVQDLLAGFGKDATLTNRTVLWADAARISQEKPWLGVGAEGFWVWWNGQAESILDYSHKRPGTKFSFHSVYYEVLVHLGRIGLGLMIFQIAWITLNAARHWTRISKIPQSLFLVIAGITLISSFTESYLFGVFDIGITLFLIAGVSAISESARYRQHIVMAPPKVPLHQMSRA